MLKYFSDRTPYVVSGTVDPLDVIVNQLLPLPATVALNYPKLQQTQEWVALYCLLSSAEILVHLYKLIVGL